MMRTLVYFRVPAQIVYSVGLAALILAVPGIIVAAECGSNALAIVGDSDQLAAAHKLLGLPVQTLGAT